MSDMEVVAEGNKPVEIVRHSQEVGELDGDKRVNAWFEAMIASVAQVAGTGTTVIDLKLNEFICTFASKEKV